MKHFIAAAALPLIFAPLAAHGQAVPFWPGGYGYQLEEVWSYRPPVNNYGYIGMGASNNRVYADRVTTDGATVQYDVIDASSGQYLTQNSLQDGYKTSLICGRSTGFTIAGGVFNGIKYRPENAGGSSGWLVNFSDNAGYTGTMQLSSFLRPSFDSMGCEGDSVYPAFCNGNYDQDTGALVAGTQGECFVAKYDAISGKNEWTAKWKTGDFATAGSVYITSGAIWVAGVANNIDGTSAGGDKAKHPYLVKLGKDGEVYFSRIYPQYTVDSQMGGKNVLGMNTNGGLFMVVGGSVVTVDQGNGDVIKSFILSGARSGSVTAVPASSDYLLLPYSTPAQPRVFDVDGNVIQLRFANGAYNDNIISMMINPANNQQVFVATPGSIALMNLRKSALADNGGNNPTGQTNTNKTTSSVTSISKTTTQTTVALTSTSAAPSTTIAAETTSVAAVPKSTSVASSGFRAAPAGLVSALLAAVAAAFAL